MTSHNSGAIFIIIICLVLLFFFLAISSFVFRTLKKAGKDNEIFFSYPAFREPISKDSQSFLFQFIWSFYLLLALIFLAGGIAMAAIIIWIIIVAY